MALAVGDDLDLQASERAASMSGGGHGGDADAKVCRGW